MGEDIGSRISAPESLRNVTTDVALDEAEAGEATAEAKQESPEAISRRRFTIAAVIAVALTSLPYLWILCGPWESPNPLRKTNYQDNFYDLQARAIFHGHLWLPNGSIGIEAFVYNHHQYTYFGLFPSLIRMPILAFTHSLDGKLTAPFMLLAWLLTGLLASLLVWRVRFLIRGPAMMSRTEATTFGMLIATIMGGTILLLLAATPFVFNEDIAWSVCLVTGSIFTLLGVLERPSWGRLVASGAFLLAANLDRATTAWAASVGAILIAVWFRFGRSGRDDRRWFLPVLGVGLIPLFVGFAVNYIKFDTPIGVSNFDQVWTHVNAYRRRFLASNHNSEAGIKFLPSTLLAYLRPNGLRLTPVFPFITLPAAPAHAVSGVLFDRRYRTVSVPSSTPLLFALSIWGLITAFRPKPIGRVALTRILLVASAGAIAPLLVWGYMAPRYLGDFVPFLVLASAVATVDICRRLEGRNRSTRVGALTGIGALALFSIAANIGISVTPTEEWSTAQVLHYVEAQKSISDLTGHPLNSQVTRGSSLPGWGPADQLYVIGDCDGLYISNGEDYSTVPSDQFQRMTWMTVERGPLFQHTFRITLNRSASDGTATLPLVSTGGSTVSVSATTSSGQSTVKMSFQLRGRGGPVQGVTKSVPSGSVRQVVVITDPVKHIVQVKIGSATWLSSPLTDGEPIGVHSGTVQSPGTPPALSIVNVTGSAPSLCESLIR
ncbi:MAG TPA: hypothetical protein VK283_03505 [Acidimicrobiales bacterium]|nr:hypothetical protein [Acidimicrobiales bacterium]